MDKNKLLFIFIQLNHFNKVINIYHDTILYMFHIIPFHLIHYFIILNKNNKLIIYDVLDKKNQLIIYIIFIINIYSFSSSIFSYD